jgi:hypothetical protein
LIGVNMDDRPVTIKAVCSISEQLLQRRPISEMIEIVYRLYALECSFYIKCQFLSAAFPCQMAAKFINAK